MPIMNGVQATKKLRKMNCKCKIIGHTAYQSPNDIKTCLEAGMNTVLKKPSKEKAILHAVLVSD